MIVTTTNDVAGKKLFKCWSCSRYNRAHSNYYARFFGNIKNIFGGHNQAFTDMCEQTRNAAYQNMIQQAQMLGANGIVAMRYDSDSVGGDRTRTNEVFAMVRQ